MLDLRKLQTFQVAAATNSFTRAAAELGCCQSSVTVHIRALEDELESRCLNAAVRPKQSY